MPADRSSGRAVKRARKKDRRNAQRAAIAEAVRRRRRQRLMLLGASLLVIAIGVGIVFLTRPESKKTAAPTRSPGAALNPAVPTPGPVACGAKRPAAAGSRKPILDGAKNQNLSGTKIYVWELQTSCGDIAIELDTKRAPKTANSVAYLSRRGFFDGLFFHRISAQVSVIQAGDPRGDGTGGSGYQVVEPPPEGTHYTRGVVAMAKSGTDPPGASGSQFFIVFGDAAKDLPPDYAIVGKVVGGMDIVDKIAKLGKPDESPKEYTYIERATVEERT